MTTHSLSNSPDPASINLPNTHLKSSKIYIEVENSISTPETQKIINNIKNRIVHSVKDYNEFKRLVQCHDLNSVNHEEINSLYNIKEITTDKRWNYACDGDNHINDKMYRRPKLETWKRIPNDGCKEEKREKNDSVHELKENSEQEKEQIELKLNDITLPITTSPPTTLPQLQSELRHRTPHHTLLYLIHPHSIHDPITLSNLRINPQNTHRIQSFMSSELNEEVFGRIVQALVECVQNELEKCKELACEWLVSLSQCKRLSVTLMFLDTKRREDLERVLKWIGNEGLDKVYRDGM